MKTNWLIEDDPSLSLFYCWQEISLIPVARSPTLKSFITPEKRQDKKRLLDCKSTEIKTVAQMQKNQVGSDLKMLKIHESGIRQKAVNFLFKLVM